VKATAKISLGITVNPKQFHAFRVDVELELPLVDDTEVPIRDQIDNWRRECISPLLQRAVYEAVKKLYGEANARAMISVYFDTLERKETS
jgi:hypothetical protein